MDFASEHRKHASAQTSVDFASEHRKHASAQTFVVYSHCLCMCVCACMRAESFPRPPGKQGFQIFGGRLERARLPRVPPGAPLGCAPRRQHGAAAAAAGPARRRPRR